MEVRPDIKFYSTAALRHPIILKQALQEENFICSMLAINTLPEHEMLTGVAIPYIPKHLEEIFNKYYPIDNNITKNWDVYTAVEYDKFVRPDEIIFVGEQWETDLASKYFGDGMLETVK